MMSGLIKLLVRIVVLVCIGMGLGGCGTVKTMPDLSLYGEANPELERNHIETYKKNKAIDVNEVKVLVDTVPEGISVSDGQMSNESDYEHEIIGYFSFSPDYKRQDSDALDVFTNYKAGWRKAVCYPQVPLRYVTLGLWKIIPTSYPCYGSISQSKEDMISEAQKITKITGGNVATISYLKDRENKTLGAVGYAIKLDPRFEGDFATKEAELTKSKEL